MRFIHGFNLTSAARINFIHGFDLAFRDATIGHEERGRESLRRDRGRTRQKLAARPVEPAPAPGLRTVP